MKDKEFQDKMFSFLQERGFVWGPSPEIYGGVSGFYDYGPLGKLIKEKIIYLLRRSWQKNNFWEVECPQVMPEAVWKASGHLKGFTDAFIECGKCKAKFKVEQILAENGVKIEHHDIKSLEKLLNSSGIKCLSCGAVLKGEVKQHNLMMATEVGVGQKAFFRPETATTTYLPFIRYFDLFRKRLPFRVFQIGKAFRNEISPRQLTLRMREFTQAESQMFIFNDQKKEFKLFDKIQADVLRMMPSSTGKEEEISLGDALKKGYIKNKAFGYNLWLATSIFKTLGIESIRVKQHSPDEMAFYADDAWDIEFELKSFGWFEICGVHDRTDYDLRQHGKESRTNMAVSDETHKKEIPHIIEIAFGVDRLLFAVLDMSFEPLEIEQGKTTMHIPIQLAPIQAAVFPLVKKELSQIAKRVYDELKEGYIVVYDESGSIGRRYLRAAEQGIPFCITIDHDTLKDDSVTIRDRDSERQIRRKISELNNVLYELITRKKSFEEME